MLHIYRQITALERFRPMVIAQKREEAERFPFAPVFVVGKPRDAFSAAVLVSNSYATRPGKSRADEVAQIERLLAKNDAQLLHIYFGHIAVHLLPLIRHWPKPTVVSFHGADVLVDLDKPRYRAATREMLTRGAARALSVPNRLRARSTNWVALPERFGCNAPGFRWTKFPFAHASLA